MCFLVIDGVDGVGKTTLAKKLVSNIKNAIYTCEPTQKMHKHDLALYIEDRKEHQKQIKEWLKEGKKVICDRYKYSMLVYQQIQGYNPDFLIDLNKDFLVPDLTFIIMSDINTIMRNIEARGIDRDAFECRKTLKKALNIYGRMHEYYPEENIIYASARLN